MDHDAQVELLRNLLWRSEAEEVGGGKLGGGKAGGDKARED